MIKKEHKKGYKVVTPELRSAVVSKVDCTVEYKVNASVEPMENCGPLTVFKNQGAATHFKNALLPPLQIYKCFYAPSEKKEVWYPFGYSFRKESLEDLLILNSLCIIPNSVDLADEVILTEKL